MLLQLSQPRLRNRKQDAPPGLPKEGLILPFTGEQLHLCPDTGFASERHLGERNREATAREVVSRVYNASGDSLLHRVRDRFLGREIRRGRRAGYPTVHYLQVIRAVEGGT